jgi:signal transduction histidine kinase
MPLTLYPRATESGGDQGIGTPEIESSPDLREELLDPAAWQAGLEQYARAMHMAVALVDPLGQLLGPCLNPQLLWSLLRDRQPAKTRECPFAIKCSRPCTCIADALSRQAVVRGQDCTGLVHFAVPLQLHGEALGALLAGQVFDQFPEQLPLEQVAKIVGLSPEKVWEKARLEHPVRPSALRVYEDLLATFVRTFVQGRYHALLEASRLNQLRRAEKSLRLANSELERRVEERTAELYEAQKKALQAERLAAIGQMDAGLAHESRNALQRIQASVTRLEFRLRAEPEALDLVNTIQKAQDDLHRLFDEVRHYAAPVHLEVQPCDLAEVWRGTWAELGPAREGREAELREETAGTDLQCVASPFHLKQVFRNVLHNALAAARDPVRIVISCSAAAVGGQAGVQIAVRDNGPGFAKEECEKAFEPFFTTKAKGTGLGLAICKRIIEGHGGTIEVGADGRPGAEIIVTLPRRAQ